MTTWFAYGSGTKKTAGWTHGSPHEFDKFNMDGDPYSDAWDDKHWNTYMGPHFTSEHSTAAEFAHKDSPDEDEWPGHIYHVGLTMKNPKHYDSEHDMDKEAYHHGVRNGDLNGSGVPLEKHQHADYIRDAYDEETEEPKAPGVAASFKQHLRSQGHDGITYGNMHEGTRGHKCAIPFDEHQINVKFTHPANVECNEDHHEEAPRKQPEPDPNQLELNYGKTSSLDLLAFFKTAEADESLWPKHPLFRPGDRVQETTPNGNQYGATVDHQDESDSPDNHGTVWMNGDGERGSDRGLVGVHPNRLTPHPDAPAEQHEHYQKQKAKNDAGEPYVPEKERNIDEDDRVTVHHLTDKHDFKPDPSVRPENNTTLGGHVSPRLFVGSPTTWAEGEHHYRRPYVAEMSVPKGALTNTQGYLGENEIHGRHFDKVKVNRVLPYHEYDREQEDPDYHSPVDTRDWTPAQHKEHLKAHRTELHEQHGWGWNEFDRNHNFTGISEDDTDGEGMPIRRDRKGKPMTQHRSSLDLTEFFKTAGSKRTLDDYDVSDRQYYHGGGKVSLEHKDEHVGDFQWGPSDDQSHHEVMDVWVHPEHRGHGLGRQMKDHAEEKYGVEIHHSGERTKKGDRWAQGLGAMPVDSHVEWPPDDHLGREGSKTAGGPLIFYPAKFGGKYHLTDAISETARCRGSVEVDKSGTPIHVQSDQDRIHPIICQRCLKSGRAAQGEGKQVSGSLEMPEQSFSTAFTAPGYHHVYSPEDLPEAMRRMSALHDISKPKWSSGDPWATDEEKAEKAKQNQDANDKFHDDVIHEGDLPKGVKRHEVNSHWEGAIRHALTTGKKTIDEAEKQGYRSDAREHGEKHHELDETQDNWVEKRHGGWQSLAANSDHYFHVSTDADKVAEEGLKTRKELGHHSGSTGLGGGTDDTVSVTDDSDLPHDIYHSLHEHHAAVTGKITPQQLYDYAKDPPAGVKPFHESMVKPGTPQEEEFDRLKRGMTKSPAHAYTADPDGGKDPGPGFNSMMRKSEAAKKHPNWSPVESSRIPGGDDSDPRYGHYERPSTDFEKTHAHSEFYKSFSHSRDYAGGHRDPLFMSNDPVKFAKTDPKKFGILHLTPHPKAQGYPLRAGNKHHEGADSGEWRMGSGSPFDVTHVEKPRPRHLDEFGDEDHKTSAYHYDPPKTQTHPDDITPEHIQQMKDITHEVRRDAGLGGQCYIVSEENHLNHGWDIHGGVYHSKDGKPLGDHVWNVHNDTGTIIDATADQWGEGHHVRVLPKDHPDHARYKQAADEDQEDDWLDQARDTRKKRGDYWWAGGKNHPNVKEYTDREKKYENGGYDHEVDHKTAAAEPEQHSLYRGLYIGSERHEHPMGKDTTDDEIMDRMRKHDDWKVRSGQRMSPEERDASPHKDRWPMFGQHWTEDHDLAHKFAFDSQHGRYRHPGNPQHGTLGVVLEAKSKVKPEQDTLGSQFGESEAKWPGRSNISGITAHVHYYHPDMGRMRPEDTYLRSFDIPEEMHKHAVKDEHWYQCDHITTRSD